MKSMTINTDYQEDIREFIITTQGTKDQQDELAKFLEMISPSLKQQVAIKIFSKVVLQNKRLE